jgi:hypothetical protein
MPGISASLTPQAYAIWETVPKKERGNPARPGRSAWLSKAIIDWHGLSERHHELLREKFEVEDKLLMMTAARDKLQEIVLERDS